MNTPNNFTLLTMTKVSTCFIFALLLILCVAPRDDAFAVSAERGDFVTLGRTAETEQGEEAYEQEMVNLYIGPAIEGIVQAQLKSGTMVQVLERIDLEAGSYYNVSTVGPGGGIIGWVSEAYIYEVIIEPEIE